MEFDVLKELAKTITRNKIKNIEVLGNNTTKKNKIDLFFDGLNFDKFKNEKEVVRFFFNSYDVKHAGYQKLKNKLIQQLVNTSFFVDVNQPNFNERAKSYFTSYKNLASAVVLATRGSSKAASYLLQLVLEQAIKYEFTDLAADSSRWLRWEHARGNHDFEKNIYYSNLHQKYEKIRYYEFLAFNYHEELISYYIHKRSPNLEINAKSTLYFDELIKVADKINTSRFYKYTYNIGIIKYVSANDTLNAINICNQGLSVLQNRENVNRHSIAGFKMQMIAFYTQLREKDIAIPTKLFNDCLLIFQEGDFSWFRVHESYFYYCFCSSMYAEALYIYEKVNKSNGFNLLGGIYHDNWLLLGGYLHLLTKFEVLDFCEVETIVGKFKFIKLFNNIEILKKDKDGMNIPLIFLPIIYELAQKPSERKNEIPIEALEKYRQRWLTNDINRRSNSFLKILIALSKGNYDKTIFHKKIKKEFEIIKNETPEVSGQYFAIEVIPYETLLELLFSKLGLKSILE